MNFNERLIELRKAKGLSQEQLGEKLNVARQTVSKWELGTTTPEMNKLIALANLFSISLDELVGNSLPAENRQSELRRFEYEYISKTKIRGLPLVHINVGYGIRKAKGIVAIGNIAKGLLSIGVLSMGILSFGGLSLGLFTFAGLSLGFLLAIGGIAIGTISVGGGGYRYLCDGRIGIRNIFHRWALYCAENCNRRICFRSYRYRRGNQWHNKLYHGKQLQ